MADNLSQLRAHWKPEKLQSFNMKITKSDLGCILFHNFTLWVHCLSNYLEYNYIKPEYCNNENRKQFLKCCKITRTDIGDNMSQLRVHWKSDKLQSINA